MPTTSKSSPARRNHWTPHVSLAVRPPSIQFKPVPTESPALRWVQIICFLVLAAFVFFAAYMMWFVKTLGPMAP